MIPDDEDDDDDEEVAEWGVKKAKKVEPVKLKKKKVKQEVNKYPVESDSESDTEDDDGIDPRIHKSFYEQVNSGDDTDSDGASLPKKIGGSKKNNNIVI